MPSLRKRAVAGLNKVLTLFGIELVRRGQGDFAHYIPHGATLAAARRAGLPVGEYIDAEYNVPGATLATVNQMVKLGVFVDKMDRVCEIGPGSGRYLEKVLQLARPRIYEIYETAPDWRSWLVRQYGVVAQNCTGSSLGQTPTQSVDLIHAHKVLPGLPVFTTCGYFEEMVRVTRPGGMLVFDVLTEACLTDELMRRWLEGHQWPQSMIPKAFAVDFFASRGFNFVGSFVVPMVPGITEYLAFRRREVP